jgi:hypothetical protein
MSIVDIVSNSQLANRILNKLILKAGIDANGQKVMRPLECENCSKTNVVSC